MVSEVDYVELGLACADVCRALARGTDGRRVDQLSQSVLKAIEQLATWVEPATHTPGNSFTVLSTAGSLPKSRGTLPSAVNGR